MSAASGVEFQRSYRLLNTIWLFMFHIAPVPEVPVSATAFQVLDETNGYHVPVNPRAAARL